MTPSPSVPSLAERIRGVLAPASHGSKPAAVAAVPSAPGETPAAAAPANPQAASAASTASAVKTAIEQVLGGQWIDAEAGGRSFVVERRLSPDERCGAVRVGDLATRLHAVPSPIELLAGAKAATLPYLLFDLETTGLSGGAGTFAFLIGFATFDADGSFVCTQLLVSHPAQERAMLQRLAAELGQAGALVSFNGRSFDAPLLEMRYAFHRMPWPGDGKPHVDVLHPARRFWSEEKAVDRRDQPERSCSLSTLEQRVLGIERHDDVPGAEAPARYFDFMRTGDARVLAPVLEHNRRDLLSLAALLGRLLHLLDVGPSAACTAREAFALGRFYERSDEPRAQHAYVTAIEMSRRAHGGGRVPAGRAVRAEAQRALALMARRRRRHEEAASLWQGVLKDAPRGTPLSREAAAALAVHAEHRAGDLAAAKRFALDSLDSRVAAGSGWDRAVSRRLARLERKLAGAAGLGPRLLDPAD